MSRTVNVDQLKLVTSAIPSQSILLHEISGKLYANNKLVGEVTEELFSATTGDINNSITGLQNDLSILVGDAPEHLDTIFELADFASGIDSTVSGLVTKEVFSAATGDIDQSISGLQSQLTLLVGDAPEHLDTIFELADFASGIDSTVSGLVTKEVFSAATGDIDQSISGLQSQLTLLVGDAPEHLDTIFELADFASGIDSTVSGLVTKEVFSAATGDIDQSISGLQSQLTLLVGDAPEHLDTIFELADFASGIDSTVSGLVTKEVFSAATGDINNSITGLQNDLVLLVGDAPEELDTIYELADFASGLDVRVSGLESSPSISPNAPALPTSLGSAGDIAYDSDYMYICVNDNSWKRTALASWA